MRDRRRRMYMLRSSGTARMASIRKLKVLSGPVGVGPAHPRCMQLQDYNNNNNLQVFQLIARYLPSEL